MKHSKGALIYQKNSTVVLLVKLFVWLSIAFASSKKA